MFRIYAEGLHVNAILVPYNTWPLKIPPPQLTIRNHCQGLKQLFPVLFAKLNIYSPPQIG
jgi:hypothetical protein